MTDDIPAMRVCGVRIDAIDADRAATEIIKRAGEPLAVHLCNAYTLSLATKDPNLDALLDRGDLNLPDGMPLVWIARRLGIPLADRAYGPDVMANVLDRGREQGLRHYLYGSSPEVLEALERNILERWPGVEVVGRESPPFRELTEAEEQSMVNRVRATEAKIVWVGLGTPKQDHFVERFACELGATCVAVGAAFDFHAGIKRQAPHLIQSLGLEWAWRFANEHKRLANRYVIGNIRFVKGCIRHPLHRTTHGHEPRSSA